MDNKLVFLSFCTFFIIGTYGNVMYTDWIIVYGEPIYHKRANNGNAGHMSVSNSSFISSTSGQITYNLTITACVYKANKVAEETALNNITDEAVNNALVISYDCLEALIKDTLKSFNGSYDAVIHMFLEQGSHFAMQIDNSSPVIHRFWNITGGTNGTWHTIIYPAMGPGDVCIEEDQFSNNHTVETTTTPTTTTTTTTTTAATPPPPTTTTTAATTKTTTGQSQFSETSFEARFNQKTDLIIGLTTTGLFVVIVAIALFRWVTNRSTGCRQDTHADQQQTSGISYILNWHSRNSRRVSHHDDDTTSDGLS